MKKILIIFLVVAGVFVFKGVAMAAAAKPAILGTFGVWTAYLFKDGNAKVCYMSASVSQANPRAGRDDIFLTVTHRPKEKSYNVISYAGNYKFKKATTPSIRVDKNKAVSLLGVSDMAWCEDSKTDKYLTDSMEKGNAAYVSGQSIKGTKITDTFSLKGFGKAYDAITKACGK